MIKELLNNLIRRHYKKRALKELRGHNRHMLEMETLLESWISKRILDGQTGRREELIKKQQGLREIEAFLEWLKTQ